MGLRGDNKTPIPLPVAEINRKAGASLSPMLARIASNISAKFRQAAILLIPGIKALKNRL